MSANIYKKFILIHINRMIVGDMPGLTRDAVSVEWTHKERLFK